MFFEHCSFHGGRNDTLTVGGTIKDAQAPIDEIESGETVDRTLPDHFLSFGGLPLDSADVQITVTFRPRFWWHEIPILPFCC